MSAASLEAPLPMVLATLRGEEPLAGRPAPARWRLNLAVALMLAILMHLGLERKADLPYVRLGEIIEGMTRKGYAFTRISQMM